jgi:hypothetical protein
MESFRISGDLDLGDLRAVLAPEPELVALVVPVSEA